MLIKAALGNSVTSLGFELRMLVCTDEVEINILLIYLCFYLRLL